MYVPFHKVRINYNTRTFFLLTHLHAAIPHVFFMKRHCVFRKAKLEFASVLGFTSVPLPLILFFFFYFLWHILSLLSFISLFLSSSLVYFYFIFVCFFLPFLYPLFRFFLSYYYISDFSLFLSKYINRR